MYVEPRIMVQMNQFAGQKLRHRCREETYGHQGGKLRWGGDGGVLNWAIGIDMYTLVCIKLMTNMNLQYKKTNKTTKCSIWAWIGYDLYKSVLNEVFGSMSRI